MTMVAFNTVNNLTDSTEFSFLPKLGQEGQGVIWTLSCCVHKGFLPFLLWPEYILLLFKISYFSSTVLAASKFVLQHCLMWSSINPLMMLLTVGVSCQASGSESPVVQYSCIFFFQPDKFSQSVFRAARVNLGALLASIFLNCYPFCGLVNTCAASDTLAALWKT